MPVTDAKFSNFNDGGDLQTDDIVVGLRDGVNTRFVFTEPVVPVTSIGAGAGIECTPDPIVSTGTVALATIADDRVMANITGSTAVPSPNTLTAIIDACIGSTQGDLLYRNGAAWVVLAPGTAGQFLQTGGAAANPSWSTSTFPTTAGTAGNILISNGTNYVASTSLWPNTVGAAGKILRSDGTTNAYTTATFADTYGASTILYSNGANTVTGLATANSSVLVTTSAGVPVQSGTMTNGQLIIGSTGATPVVASLGAGTGIATTTGAGTLSVALAAIADHTLLANTSGGSAAPVSTTLTALIDNAIGSTQGQILYRNATSWTVLNPGTAGQFLQTGGAAANPSWASESGTGTVTSLTEGTGIDLTPNTITTTGSIALAAIADHTVLANISGGSAAPSSTTLTALIDNAIGSVQGDILYRNATSWVVLPPGTSGKFLRTNGAGADPSWEAEAGTGTVTSVATGTGLTGGTITTTGTLSFASIGAHKLWANITGSSAVPTEVSTSTFLQQVVRQVISASGTYTPTTGMVFADVEVLGGGGGGGGVANCAAANYRLAAGGGAGGYARKLYTAAEIGANASVTIGALGAGGANTGANGGTGGATSFDPAGSGATITGNGGVGGTYDSIDRTTLGWGGGESPGAGGSASNGDINVTGQYGQLSIVVGLTNIVNLITGIGGSSIYGSGGTQNVDGTRDGRGATGKGAGGSGAATVNAAGAGTGGDGTAGIVIVTEYIAI